MSHDNIGLTAGYLNRHTLGIKSHLVWKFLE